MEFDTIGNGRLPGNIGVDLKNSGIGFDVAHVFAHLGGLAKSLFSRTDAALKGLLDIQSDLAAKRLAGYNLDAP